MVGRGLGMRSTSQPRQRNKIPRGQPRPTITPLAGQSLIHLQLESRRCVTVIISLLTKHILTTLDPAVFRTSRPSIPDTAYMH